MLFGVFIISNAIICSVAVWNFFIAQAINHILQIDAFLIVTAALALAFIVVLITASVVRRNSVVTSVWFECLWVLLFFVLEFSGAVAVSVTAPAIMCPAAPAVVISGSCSSTQVLMAFTWICSVCLLAYLLLVVIAAYRHSKNDRRVWTRAIRHMTLSQPESAAPPLPPARPVAQRRSFMSIVAPRPRRLAPSALYAFSGGFGNDEKLQSYMYQEPQGRNRQSIQQNSYIPPPMPAAAPPRRLVQRARESALPAGHSFYPQNVQVAMQGTSTIPGDSQTRYQRPQRPRDQPRTPPPLGNWPRADILSQPVVRGNTRRSSSNRQPSGPPTSARPNASPRSSPRTAPASRPLMLVASPPPSAPPVSFSAQRQRPSGPRSRAMSRERSRPPPLDLTGISANGLSGRRT